MGTKRVQLCVLSVVVVAALAAPAAQAKVPPRPHHILQTLVTNPTFPAEWSGIWNITTTEYECGSSTPSDMYTELDTLCTGGGFADPDEAFLTCEGTIDGTSLDVTCTGSYTEEGCTITITTSATGTLSGDSFSGSGRYEISYSGTCSFLPDECYDETYSGSRIGPEPPNCSTVPALPTTWGLLKARYVDGGE